MNLVLVFAHEVDGDAARLEAKDSRAKHIVRHLRKKVGDSLRVGIVDGPIGEATVSETSGDVVALQLDRTTLRPPPPRPHIEVLLGMPYPGVLKRMWAVWASMGVSRVCVFSAELSDPEYGMTSALTSEVYEPLVLEGLAQSLDTRRPVVDSWHDRKLEDVLAMLPGSADDARLLFDLGDAPSVRDTIDSIPARTILAVGPERGWTDNEVRCFSAAGFVAVSMGKRVLRTDVASIAAIALVSDVLRHMQHRGPSSQHNPSFFDFICPSLDMDTS
ncbi:hypothetical protein CTAYLR_001250 [Chrysophaeum taylorii]|uniref:16S rRNA (uracil(1498)-N(3))-methyltransferase n=1 Tax=Chrysophaeum taylorii TaxID=2483200 RepID=A0AAD7UF24_9STRA|nr:hypothetical protein CTAYLR_001250 [Chrysophaeum taylorii]